MVFRATILFVEELLMKRQILTWLLACALVVGMVGLPAAAFDVQNQTVAGLEYFVPVRNYIPGTFTDVSASSWYAESVAQAYEYGLVKGTSDTTYNPRGDIKLGETIALACRIYNIYYGGNGQFNQSGTHWYDVYVQYAIQNGIIRSGEFSNYSAPATRAEFAGILGRCLPDSALQAKNTVEDGALAGLPSGYPYRSQIYKLYRAGVLTGNDNKGLFSPDNYIKRSEVAAIIVRMVDLSQRKTVTFRAAPVNTNAIRFLTNMVLNEGEAETRGNVNGGYDTYYSVAVYLDEERTLYFSVDYSADTGELQFWLINDVDGDSVTVELILYADNSAPADSFVGFYNGMTDNYDVIGWNYVYQADYTKNTYPNFYVDVGDATSMAGVYSSGMDLILSVAENILNEGGYTIRDLGFRSYNSGSAYLTGDFVPSQEIRPEKTAVR